MAAKPARNPLTHFGRQVRKERAARGWTLRDLADRAGLAAPYLSQIENGVRPPTERVALACDRVFPERGGWFLEYYQESRTWMPPGFKDWRELEDKAARLSVWSPGILHGLLQTQDYARAMIAIEPGITEDIARIRLASRLERQKRVLLRDDPPTAWFVVDLLSLYRLVGSPDLMAGQMDHLLTVADMPRVTLTVMPAVTHPANASEFIIADDSAAYVEHMIGGGTYSDETAVSGLSARFDFLRGECYRVSDSAALIREMRDIWRTGANPLTQAATEDHA